MNAQGFLGSRTEGCLRGIHLFLGPVDTGDLVLGSKGEERVGFLT